MTGIILINLFITALIFTLCACGVLITLFGAFVFTKLIIMPNKAPADVSNRINHIRLDDFKLFNTHPPNAPTLANKMLIKVWVSIIVIFLIVMFNIIVFIIL